MGRICENNQYGEAMPVKDFVPVIARSDTRCRISDLLFLAPPFDLQKVVCILPDEQASHDRTVCSSRAANSLGSERAWHRHRQTGSGASSRLPTAAVCSTRWKISILRRALTQELSF